MLRLKVARAAEAKKDLVFRAELKPGYRYFFIVTGEVTVPNLG
ncbi:MAG: hypothetical protein ABSF90_16060 [Syntrophobacteraceae bacterium]